MQSPSVVVIGNFDGVHRGHQAVVVDTVARARAAGLRALVLTFDPHPGAVLGRGAPPRLTTLARRHELLLRGGIDTVVVRAFDRAFAAWSPERFARELLVGELRAQVVVVGDNFRFGKDREGDFAGLVKLGEKYGFTARAHDVAGDAIGPFSSSRVRGAVAVGDVEAAADVLGRWHAVSGVVEHGKKLGRTLGFPTANLGAVPELMPRDGIYAVVVDELTCVARAVGDAGVSPTGEGPARALAKGVMSIGTRPTIEGDGRRTCEVFLFDFERDLYGAALRVHVVARQRDEQKFADLAALTVQMARDTEEAKRRLAALEPAVLTTAGRAFG